MTPMDPSLLPRMAAGVMVPLSAVESLGGLGIGEFPDLPRLCDWAAHCGLKLILLLPVLEAPPGESSPYSALTSFALDLLYLRLDDAQEIARSPLARRAREAKAFAREAAALQAASRAHHGPTRALKWQVLDAAFQDWRAGVTRSAERDAAFQAFRAREQWWLSVHCRFQVLARLRGTLDWRQWPAAERDRTPDALAAVDRDHADDLLRLAFAQWLLDEQWQAARRHARAKGIVLMGDLPFGVATASVDVWCHAQDFDLTHTVGCPPDAFNEDGQEWGLPAPRWDVMASNGYRWWRARVRRTLELVDTVRIDHVIGLFRTFVIPLGKKGKDGRYVPADAADQDRQGQAVLDALLAEAGKDRLVAEDLGWPPPFLLPAIRARDIPGYRVLRWVTPESSTQLMDPADYPECALATTGTHDTSTLAAWWESELDQPQRDAILLAASKGAETAAPGRLTDKVRRLLLRWVLAGRARLVVLPVQDLFGWKQRFNLPGTVGPHNWTWRMPVAVEHLLADKRTKVPSTELRDMIRDCGR